MIEPSSLADAILEIPAQELQHFFDDLILTFDSLNDLLKDQGILRGRELAELNTRAAQAVKTARSPMEKLLAPKCLHQAANKPRKKGYAGQAAHNAHRQGSDQAGYYKDRPPGSGHCRAC